MKFDHMNRSGLGAVLLSLTFIGLIVFHYKVCDTNMQALVFEDDGAIDVHFTVL